MDNTTNQRTNQAENLIDILYKDDYRVKSYIAQMLAGAVQSVKKQTTSSIGSSFDAKASAAFAKGGYLRKQNETSMTETEADVHDHAVMLLLQELALEPSGELPADATGVIIHLRGELSLRDYSSFNDLASIVGANPAQFGTTKKDVRDVQNAFKGIAKLVPLGLEAEITLPNYEVARGILKEEYMLTPYRDLVAMYGTHLPGVWDVIGILDRPRATTSLLPKANLRTSMDAIASAAKQLYDSGDNAYTITPFLIYRELSR